MLYALVQYYTDDFSEIPFVSNVDVVPFDTTSQFAFHPGKMEEAFEDWMKEENFRETEDANYKALWKGCSEEF